jgi:transposase
MSRKKTWEISDDFWAIVEPLIPSHSRPDGKCFERRLGGGRKPKYSNRVFFAAIVYVLRNGLIWNALPREKFDGVSPAMVHRKFQQWAGAGFFLELWKKGLAEYDALEGIAWQWQSADGTMSEAPLALESVGPNPTDRGKKRQQAASSRGREWSPVVHRRQRSESA